MDLYLKIKMPKKDNFETLLALTYGIIIFKK